MNLSLLIGLVVFILILSGCTQNVGYGTLDGTITIGPLCPVEKNPPDPACKPTLETYASWPISVWAPDGTQIAQISPALNGSYSLKLTTGNYIIDLDNPARLGQINLPKNITISANATTIYDITIDTGIR